MDQLLHIPVKEVITFPEVQRCPVTDFKDDIAGSVSDCLGRQRKNKIQIIAVRGFLLINLLRVAIDFQIGNKDFQAE